VDREVKHKNETRNWQSWALSFITSIALSAWVMLGYWFLIQFVSGLTTLRGEMGGVAFWAHIGGFVAGVALVKAFARSDYVSAHQAHHWRPQRVLRDF
jgi:membrane associated rhomboid family serine protease